MTKYRHLQMVFQNPEEAFSPRMTIEDFLLEPLFNFLHMTRKEALTAIDSFLKETNTSRDLLHRYAHEVSGGQLQRIVIIRALLLHPKIILFDEPTSALDVITQNKILTLIQKERKIHHFAGLFVSHDLAVVQQITDRVMIMESGTLVEELPAGELKKGLHPCTQRLIYSQLPEDGHHICSAKRESILCSDGNDFWTIWGKEKMKEIRTHEPEMITVDAGHTVRAYLV